MKLGGALPVFAKLLSEGGILPKNLMIVLAGGSPSTVVTRCSKAEEYHLMLVLTTIIIVIHPIIGESKFNWMVSSNQDDIGHYCVKWVGARANPRGRSSPVPRGRQVQERNLSNG